MVSALSAWLPYRPIRLPALLSRLQIEQAVVLGLLLVTLVAHGINMLHYPAFTFKDDEGIYAEQAWAVLRQGRLTPYTYTYDHAPAGWLLVAAWMWLTGGPGTFGGSAIYSGRVLMLVLHLAMALLLYRIARRLSAGVVGAAAAVFLLAVSPLAVFYERMLLLDNIMLFWLLASIALLLDGPGRLSRIALSAVCFGLAVLSKETAIFLAPALVLLLLMQRRRHQGHFGPGAWFVLMLTVVSWYPLYAGLKDELIPAGRALQFLVSGHGGASVSLVEAWKWQASRGGGGIFNPGNLFWQLLRTDWLPRDPLLLAGGVAATIANMVRGRCHQQALAVGLLGLLPLLYLARGGVVFDYYVVFAVPFLCLNLALLAEPLLSHLRPEHARAAIAVCACLLLIGYWRWGTLTPLYSVAADRAGRETVAWIRSHLPSETLIISRDDMWADLHEQGPTWPAFPHAESHWKAGLDPAIREGVFHDDWRTVDYMVITPGMKESFESVNNTVALEAFAHSRLVKTWISPRDDGRLQPQQIVELWKVEKKPSPADALLAGGASYMIGRFEDDGAYADSDGTVTSESEAYAMLRAVWLDDRATFYRAWLWTSRYLLRPDGLVAWLWRDGDVVDPNTASDADTDMALALLLASRRWNDPVLLDAGQRMVKGIWEHDVASLQGGKYVTAGDWTSGQRVIAINPSYLAPYAYRIFQAADSAHDWQAVIDTAYRTLAAVSAHPLDARAAAGLPPDWVGLDRTTGQLTPLQSPAEYTTNYGYDAPRAFWRVALDLRWTGDARARAYLQEAAILADELRRTGSVSRVYGHDGTVLGEGPSMVGLAGALGAVASFDGPEASALYASKLEQAAQPTETPAGVAALSWGKPDDLYDQEWAWFALALYADRLPDLWPAS